MESDGGRAAVCEGEQTGGDRTERNVLDAFSLQHTVRLTWRKMEQGKFQGSRQRFDQ
jgi:hypothetical protein